MTYENSFVQVRMNDRSLVVETNSMLVLKEMTRPDAQVVTLKGELRSQ